MGESWRVNCVSLKPAAVTIPDVCGHRTEQGAQTQEPPASDPGLRPQLSPRATSPECRPSLALACCSAFSTSARTPPFPALLCVFQAHPAHGLPRTPTPAGSGCLSPHRARGCLQWDIPQPGLCCWDVGRPRVLLDVARLLVSVRVLPTPHPASKTLYFRRWLFPPLSSVERRPAGSQEALLLGLFHPPTCGGLNDWKGHLIRGGGPLVPQSTTVKGRKQPCVWLWEGTPHPRTRPPPCARVAPRVCSQCDGGPRTWFK